MNFGTLWVGRPLTLMEKFCLSSFVKMGHSITIFLYDMNIEVPNGVTKINAREILPKESIFTINNTYGAFSDIFRYNMILKTDLCWTDVDNICLKENWEFDDYIFGIQGVDKNMEKIVACGILHFPKDSIILKDLIDISMNIDKKKIKWGDIGPFLVTKKINEYNILNKAQNINTFYPINYLNWKTMWNTDEKSLNFVMTNIKNSHSIQLWNQSITWHGGYNFNKNIFPIGSAIYEISRKKEFIV